MFEHLGDFFSQFAAPRYDPVFFGIRIFAAGLTLGIALLSTLWDRSELWVGRRPTRRGALFIATLVAGTIVSIALDQRQESTSDAVLARGFEPLFPATGISFAVRVQRASNDVTARALITYLNGPGPQKDIEAWLASTRSKGGPEAASVSVESTDGNVDFAYADLKTWIGYAAGGQHRRALLTLLCGIGALEVDANFDRVAPASDSQNHDLALTFFGTASCDQATLGELDRNIVLSVFKRKQLFLTYGTREAPISPRIVTASGLISGLPDLDGATVSLTVSNPLLQPIDAQRINYVAMFVSGRELYFDPVQMTRSARAFRTTLPTSEQALTTAFRRVPSWREPFATSESH